MKWFIKVLQNYAGFNGRARRMEFWMYNLIFAIGFFALSLLSQISTIGMIFRIISTLAVFALIVPSIAVGVRRLHDTGKTGWWMLLAIIPFVGWIILVIFFVIDGQSQYNIYGNDPKGRHEIADPQQIIDSDSVVTFDNGAKVSISDMKCPQCGGNDFNILGVKGGVLRSVGTAAAFGAIGNIVAGKMAAGNIETEPIQYKCKKCKYKFIGEPIEAPEEEKLSAPCNIYFKREINFVGAGVPQIVYLNGIKIGPVKNGNMIMFPTHIKQNIIFVTDQYGVAFAGHYTFEAQPDTKIVVRFNRKFINSN